MPCSERDADSLREEWRLSAAALTARHEAELQSTDERWQRKLQEVRSCRFHVLTASAGHPSDSM